MGIKTIKSVIDVYKKELKRKIKLHKVILFGSYAKGAPNKDSDIDLVVISNDFRKLSTNKRFDLLYHARKHYLTTHTAMDIFGVTPEEYENASVLTTLGEVKETGIEV